MSDWSSDVCSSDLPQPLTRPQPEPETVAASAAPAAVMTRPAAPAPAPGPEPVLPRASLSDRIKVSPLTARIAEAKGIDLERSEEHTSELPSLMRISYAVFCLKNKTQASTNTPTSKRHIRSKPTYHSQMTT